MLPADNVWNTDISGLPVHARSAAWLESMSADSRNLHPDFGAFPYGLPFIVVDSNHALTTIAFDYADESDPGPYPFDGNTPIEGGAGSGGDQHALMINQDTCVLYELYDANWNEGSPTAGSGAIFDLTGSYQAAFVNGIGWNLLNLSIAGWLLWRVQRRAPLVTASRT